MIGNKKVSVVRPNPSSRKRQRILRRLFSSLNAVSQRQKVSELLKDARPSSLEKKRIPKDKLCSENASVNY